MPNATIIPCEGTTISYATTKTGTYTALGEEVTSITLPSLKQAPVEVWGLLSGFKRARPSKIVESDNAGVTFYVDTNSTTHTGLLSKAGDGTELWWKITFADGKTTPAILVFPAFIESLAPADIEAEANLEWELELHPTAKFEFTAGT
jgi:hypothetical protein